VLDVTDAVVQVRLTATALLTLPTAGVTTIDAPEPLTPQPVQLALKDTVAPLLLAETPITPVLSARKENVWVCPDVRLNVDGVSPVTVASTFGAPVAAKKTPIAAMTATGKSLNTRRLFIG